MLVALLDSSSLGAIFYLCFIQGIDRIDKL